MIRKILYFINPISGIQEKSSLKQLIIRKTTAKQIEFEIAETNAAGDYSFLRSKIQKERITDIVICGGDGTVNAVAAAITDTDIQIGVVPTGSGNGLALAAKIPRQKTAALEIIFNGKASPIDGFYVNGRFSCMLCGIGFDAAVAHAFANRKRRGLQTYIKISFAQYLTAKPYAFEVMQGTHSFSCKAFFISVANSNQFGNNFTIAPHASLSDGLLDIIIVKKMNKFMLPFSLLGQFTGINAVQNINEYAGKKNILYFQTPEFTILNPDKAPLHIDGEPVQTSARLDIKIVRNVIRLIQP